MRTADSIEETKAQKASETPASEQAQEQPRKPSPADRVIQFRWVKGQSGNPGGRPKKDFAAEFARRVLEAQGNPELLEQYATGFARQLAKGNAYTFKELAERAFGKLKEVQEITHRYEDVKDADIDSRIMEILVEIGLADQIDALGRVEGAKRGTGKTNGKAKTSDVLS
jgi:hypothetical protein